MTTISVKLTAKEIELLTSLASDQLFRREFIDPRLPGHRANPGDLSLGKQLVERLKQMTTNRVAGTAPLRRNGAAV